MADNVDGSVGTMRMSISRTQRGTGAGLIFATGVLVVFHRYLPQELIFGTSDPLLHMIIYVGHNTAILLA